MASCKDIIVQACKEVGYGPLRQRFVAFRLSFGKAEKDVEQFIMEEAACRGVLIPKTGTGEIDRTAFLAFIKEILPLIMQIISLFL